jgi:group I intron endonuclease
MSYGIIYKVRGPTGKVYVGQTTQTLKARKCGHAYRMKKGDRRTVFQLALLEHSFDSFTWEEIDSAETKEELDAKEKRWIAHYDSMNPERGYNNTGGGIGGIPNEETRRRLSEIMKGKRAGEKHPLYGKHHSEETRRRISEALRGNKHALGKQQSEEAHRKRSEAHRGKTTPLTQSDVIEIRRRIAAGEKLKSISANFNVCISCISNIKHGRSWSWLVEVA